MYAKPPSGITLQDCRFYHVMDLPGHGRVGGDWDLRDRTDEYLGGFDFNGRSVLEIGPASGFLTAEMERRGAAVTALEMPPEAGWDYVPFPAEMLDPIIRRRVDVMQRLRNSFWFTHGALELKARLAYASAYDIPAGLGRFDVAVLACVLLHCHSPLRVVEQCARRADTLIITEMHDPSLDGMRGCQFVPTSENRNWDTWWHFSPDLFVEFLQVMGFRHFRQTFHTQQCETGAHRLFTIVASRDAIQATAAVPAFAELQDSVRGLRQALAEIGARLSQPGTPPVATAPPQDDAAEVAEREAQQCALRSLPLLPNRIGLDDAGLHLAGLAGFEGRLPDRMAFFVNGLRFDEVTYPVPHPPSSRLFARADGDGPLVHARMTRHLDTLRQDRFWRFDASASGLHAPAQWRQAVHFMNPAFERFPIPSEGAMERVVGSGDPVLFAMGGAMIFRNLENWLAERGLGWSDFPRVLDWGCGVGRLTRYLVGETPAVVTGADIDPEAVAWCRANLPGGAFEQVPLQPPTRFRDEAFDMVVSVSVLTHLTEQNQDLWLAEMRRITRPGALLFLSVSGPTQLAYRGTPGALLRRIAEEGFVDLTRDPALDAVVPDPEYYRASLHSRRYIAERWSRWFEILAIEDGIAALQDFVVLKRG